MPEILQESKSNRFYTLILIMPYQRTKRNSLPHEEDAHQIALNSKLIVKLRIIPWAPEIAVYLSKHVDNTSTKQISSKKKTFGRK